MYCGKHQENHHGIYKHISCIFGIPLETLKKDYDFREGIQMLKKRFLLVGIELTWRHVYSIMVRGTHV